MFKYTKSAIEDTFDITKFLIYLLQIVIQLIYSGFIAFRIYHNMGNAIANIVLLMVSLFYVLFLLITTSEFHTKKTVVIRTNVKWIVKAIKYIANIWIIVVTSLALINNTTNNNNAAMLILFLMIIGLITSFIFDLVIMLIDNKINLIDSALRYDMELFKKEHEIQTILIKKLVKLDLNKIFPEFKDIISINKVKDVNYKQEQKSIRRKHFDTLKHYKKK